MIFNPFKSESVFKQADKLVFYKSKVRPDKMDFCFYMINFHLILS